MLPLAAFAQYCITSRQCVTLQERIDVQPLCFPLLIRDFILYKERLHLMKHTDFPQKQGLYDPQFEKMLAVWDLLPISRVSHPMKS